MSYCTVGEVLGLMGIFVCIQGEADKLKPGSHFLVYHDVRVL